MAAALMFEEPDAPPPPDNEFTRLFEIERAIREGEDR